MLHNTFLEVGRQIEEEAAGLLALQPLALPRRFEEHDGLWRGMPVHIRTHAYRGESVRYGRVAMVSGQDLQIANLLYLPHPLYPVPVFGADLVSVRPGSGMIAADLSPMLPEGPEREVQLAPLAAIRSGPLGLPSAGSLPAWAQPWFSPYHLLVRGDMEQLDGALHGVRAMVHHLSLLLNTTPPDPSRQTGILMRQTAYLAAHREEDQGLNLLIAMFGRDWAGAYLEEVLFPISIS